jgi:hypothetical protein
VFNGIKDNEVRRAILDDLHIIMYMPIEPNESIETFMNNRKNKIIESFTQHLLDDSYIQYFWTYYFQLSIWLNSQSIVIVPLRCAYFKLFMHI